MDGAPGLSYYRLDGHQIPSVHRRMERQRVNMSRHDPTVAVPHRGNAGSRIDQLHDLPIMKETCRIGMLWLHDQGGTGDRGSLALHEPLLFKSDRIRLRFLGIPSLN